MPKRAHELNASAVRDKTKPGLHAVGGVAGLYLQVQSRSARSWILRVKIGARRPDIGLGPYPDVTLEQARTRAREIREQIWRGIDPLAARQAARDAIRVAQAKRMTFDQASLACWKARSQEFKNAKHAAQWHSSLTTYASPVIGSLQVDAVEIAHVLAILQPIWTTKTETATRVRSRIEAVLEWAKASGKRSGDNPARWEALKHILPNPSKVRRKKRHHPAMPLQRMGAFMAELRSKTSLGARALQFQILTAARSGEARGATWDEFDLAAKVWSVPPERMKGGKLHRVPLSPAAMAILDNLPRFEGESLVFPSSKIGCPLSDMTLSKVIKDMHEADVKKGGEGYFDPRENAIATPHGTARSTFKDWARSLTRYPDEVSELALAHVNSDETRAAYARDELLPKRTRMMRDWAKFCASVGG